MMATRSGADASSLMRAHDRDSRRGSSTRGGCVSCRLGNLLPPSCVEHDDAFPPQRCTRLTLSEAGTSVAPMTLHTELRIEPDAATLAAARQWLDGVRGALGS